MSEPAGSTWEPVKIQPRTPNTAVSMLHHAHRGAACGACEIIALRGRIAALEAALADCPKHEDLDAAAFEINRLSSALSEAQRQVKYEQERNANNVAMYAEQLAEVQRERDDAEKLITQWAQKYTTISKERDALRDELQRTQNRSLASHCRAPGHFSSPVACECKMCLDALRARLARCVEALRRSHNCATLKADGTCEGCIVSEALDAQEKPPTGKYMDDGQLSTHG